MDLFEWVWLVEAVIVFITEMVGVFFENRTSIEPLTTVVRDRMMRHWYWWVTVFGFWAWLGVHFFIQ